MHRQAPVLLVTNDRLTRLITENGLVMYGHDVVTAADGEQAMEILGSRPKIGVLVVDTELGAGPSGLEVAKAARRLHPKIDVIYTARMPSRIGEREKVSGAPCIRTPYQPQQIVGIISELQRHSVSGMPEARVA